MPFINRCGDAPKLQTKTVTPTTSQQIITPDTGYEGLEKIVVNAPALQDKTVTADGTVTPDEGYDGIRKLTVNTPCYVFESTSNANYMDSDGNYAYHLRKFHIDDIANKFTTYPNIVYIILSDGVRDVIKNGINADNDYNYLHSLSLLPAASALPTYTSYPSEPALLSNANEGHFYHAMCTCCYDLSHYYNCLPTVSRFSEHNSSFAGSSRYFLSFIESDSSFLVGARKQSDNSMDTYYHYFGGAGSNANTYKAYFIWF